MISNKELLESIRENRDKNGRSREIVETLSGELRSPIGENRIAGSEAGRDERAIAGDIPESGSRVDGIQRDQEAAGGNDRDDRHLYDEVDEDYSRAHTDIRKPEQKPATTPRIDKPSGLAAVPSARERRERAEQLDAPKTKKRLKPVETSAPAAEKKTLLPLPFLGKQQEGGKKAEAPKRNRPLSDAEAEDIRETLRETFMGFSEALDKMITATARGHQPCMIWSSMDDKECNILVDWRLTRAKQSKEVAASTLAMINTYQQFAAGAILLPRFIETVQFYAASGGISLK